MKITYGEFLNQLAGARELDSDRWQSLGLEASLWEQFCFSDDGVRYIEPDKRKVLQ